MAIETKVILTCKPETLTDKDGKKKISNKIAVVKAELIKTVNGKIVCRTCTETKIPIPASGDLTHQKNAHKMLKKLIGKGPLFDEACFNLEKALHAAGM